jgi:Ulp1 family protease
LIAIISFLNKQIIVLDPIDTQSYSTKIAENLKLFVMDEFKNAQVAYDVNEWKIITQCSNISMQTNYYSCGIFASVRLQYWCIHRRFPTAAEFSQNDDDRFRLYMVKRILQFHSILLNKKIGRSSHLYLMNKRKVIVHNLTEEERNFGIDLTTDEIDEYLL